MKWLPLVAGLLVIALLTAGCSEQPEESGDVWPAPSLQEARYVAGDIVSKIGGQQEEPLWLILGYNSTTDMYERAFVYKKADGTWGYRKDSRIDEYPRADLESLYRVKVAHVKVSLVPITSQMVSPSGTAESPAGSAPEITGITPDSGPRGVMVTAEISGKHFVSGVTVILAGASSTSITATEIRNTGTKISCVFNLAGTDPGKRDVIVTNPDGQSDVLANGFTIKEQAPSIGGIEPFEGVKGETLTISITGLNFESPAQVYFVKGGTELEGGNVQVKNSNLLTVAFAIPADAEAGIWGVIVRNVADAQNSTTIRKFTIRNVT